MGGIEKARGMTNDALVSYRKYLEIFRRFASLDDDAAWQRELSVAHSKVGNIHEAQGRLNEAHAAFQEDLSICQRLVAKDGNNLDWRHCLGIAYAKLGSVLKKLGQVATAKGSLSRAEAELGKAVAICPDNTDWKRDLETIRSWSTPMQVYTPADPVAQMLFDSLIRTASDHFRRADDLLKIYRGAFYPENIFRLARTIMDDHTCKTMGLEVLTRKTLLLPAMIKLRRWQKALPPEQAREDLQILERDLMNWNSHCWPKMGFADTAEVEIAFGLFGVIIEYCDFSHYPPEMVADYTSHDALSAVGNSPFRNHPMMQDYVRKWNLGWQRFLPWKK